MEYRYLGNSGLQVSALSFGTWITLSDQLTEELAYECIRTAYDAGVNYFDTAEAYGEKGKSEIVLGKAIKQAGWKRSDVVISTKIFWGGDKPNERGLSRKHVIEGTEASLARLQLEYVDILLCHRADKHTPIEETVRAMTYLINQGKTFYWGTSEWSAQQIMEAYAIARREHLIPPQVEQPLYNMFNRVRVEQEYTRLYQEIGLGTTTFSPLAGGLLTGKYNDGVPDGTRATMNQFAWLLRERFYGEEAQHNIEKVKQMMPIAAELGCTMAQLALAWCMKNPNVSTVLTGASNPGQIKENFKALDIVEKLNDRIMEQIEAILDNRPEPERDFRLPHPSN